MPADLKNLIGFFFFIKMEISVQACSEIRHTLYEICRKRNDATVEY